MYFKVKNKMENGQLNTWFGYADSYPHAEGLGHTYAISKTNQQVLHIVSIEEIKPPIKNTIIVNGKRKVCRIWDNQGETLDRYTIAFKSYRVDHYGMVYPYLASSEYPFHSFGQHGESREFLTGRHLGKRVSFDSLSEDVQKLILQNI
jgi:hypothetical protein